MSETRDQLLSKLAIARQELAESQAHVAELDALQEDHHQQVEAAFKQYVQRMDILHKIDRGIIEATSIQSIVEATLKNLRQLILCQRVSVILFDWRTTEWLDFSDDSDRHYSLGRKVRTPIPVGWDEGFGTAQTRILDDLRLIKPFMPIYQQLLDDGLVSGIQALLMDRGKPIGLLGLNANTTGFFTTEHVEIATEIANELTIAIRQQQLSEALAGHTAELEQKVSERTDDLTNAKQRIEAVLNNTTDCILLVHTDLKIQQANSAFNVLFFYEVADYFGTSLITLVLPEYTDLVKKTVHSALAEEYRNNIEIRAVRKDGTVFDAELSIRHIINDGLVCTIRDITERKAYERQLRFHASLQENVSDAVIVTDLEFQIRSWNKAAERIYGWSAEEVIGKATAEILNTQYYLPNQFELSLQQLHEQGWWQGEIIQHHKNGSVRHILGSVTLIVDGSGTPFGVVSVNHDITKRKRIDEALRQSEESYRLLAENVVDVIVKLSPEGLRTYITSNVKSKTTEG